MSITNLQVVEDALREINVLSEVDSASSEQGAHAIRKLNQIMDLWREKDIDFGYFPQADTTGTCPIPSWAELAVISALAIAIAPKHGATVSNELIAIATDSIYTVARKSISEKLNNQDMSHMPAGQGHYGSGWDIQTDS